MKRNTVIQLLISSVAIATLTACSGSSVNAPSRSPSSSDSPSVSSASCDPTIAQIADNILTEVGKRVHAGGSDCTRKLIVLEERHDSRLGQIELAIMLYRLYRDYGLRHLALEGAVSEQPAPDASWFHKYPDETVRRDVALQLLQQGEVSAAGFVALVFRDFQVHSIERQKEYQVSLSEEAGNSPIDYLLAIAEQELTYEQAEKINLLVEQKNYEEALSLMLTSDPWVEKHYNMLADSSASIQEIISLVDEISRKAETVGAEVSEYENAFQEYRRFFLTASQRSQTMMEKTLLLMNENSEALMVMNTGAAHTEELQTLLQQHALSFAVIAPVSLAEDQKAARLSSPAYERKLNQQSVDRPGLLGELLDERYRKPTPNLNQPYFQSKAVILYFGTVIGRAASGGGEPPFGIDTNQFGVFDRGSSEPIYIDPLQIEKIDNGDGSFDALFPIYEKRTEQTIWLRVSKEESMIDDIDQNLELSLNKILSQVSNEPPEPPEPRYPGLPGTPDGEKPRKNKLAHDVSGWASPSKDDIQDIKSRV